MVGERIRQVVGVVFRGSTQPHQERLVPMPSRNRRLSATTDMSFGAWLGFLSTGRPRTGTSPAETPAVAGEQVVADAVGSR